MSDYIVETIESKPSALIYSPDYVFVGTFLVERLVAHGITVRVLTTQKDKWEESLAHLLPHNDVEIVAPSGNQTIVDYVFDLSFFGNQERSGNIGIKSNIRVNLAPIVSYTNAEIDLDKDSYNVRNFFLGDLYGPRIVGNEGTVAHILTESISLNTVPNLPSKFQLFPTFAPYAIDKVLKHVMTSEGQGKPVVISSKGIEYRRFVNLLASALPEVAVREEVEEEKKSLDIPRGLEVSEVPLDQDSLVATLTWLKSNKERIVGIPKKINKLSRLQKKPEDIQQERSIQIPRITPIQISKLNIIPIAENQNNSYGMDRKIVAKPSSEKTDVKDIRRKNKISLPNFNLKRLLVIFLLLFALLAAPVVSFLTGSLLVLFSLGNLKSTDVNSGVERLVSVGSSLNSFGKNWFVMWSSYPLVGEYAQLGVRAADSVEKTISVQKSVFKIKKDLNKIVEGVIGREEYPLDDYSRELALELKKLDENLGFLEASVVGSKYYSLLFRSTPFGGTNSANLRNFAQSMSVVVANLPSLLGMDKPETYVVVLQNNLELRPTGGTLVSYGLFTFDSGRLVNTEVSSIQDADDQLRGYVEPPEPLVTYLGERSWKLRDANWDPDFVSSAQRIEWFLDKELSRSVSGIIALDVEFLRRAIPLYNPSSQLEVNDENLFEVLYNQSLGPAGDTRNIQLLSQLLRSFSEEVSVGKVGVYELLNHLYVGFQEKHVLVFLHDTSSHRALAGLGYTGEVGINPCFGNCFSDLVGVYEANVGANTVNKAVVREMSFQMGVGEKGVRRSLTISLANTSQNKNNLEDLYKTYIRVVAPADAMFDEVVVSSQSQRKTQKPDVAQSGGLKEAGVFVEVSPESEATVSFSWETLENVDFKKEGEYILSWLKQPGTLSDPISVRLSFPKELEVTPALSRALTEGNIVGYNTDLDTDLLLKARWQ